jgi:hypothetical protein
VYLDYLGVQSAVTVGYLSAFYNLPYKVALTMTSGRLMYGARSHTQRSNNGFCLDMPHAPPKMHSHMWASTSKTDSVIPHALHTFLGRAAVHVLCVDLSELDP